jgi:hypothetical protein
MHGTHMSFEYYGAIKAMNFLRDNGASKDQAEAVSEAIIRHADLGQTGTLTSLGMLIQLSTVFGKLLLFFSQNDPKTPFAAPGIAWTLYDASYPKELGWTACSYSFRTFCRNLHTCRGAYLGASRCCSGELHESHRWKRRHNGGTTLSRQPATSPRVPPSINQSRNFATDKKSCASLLSTTSQFADR